MILLATPVLLFLRLPVASNDYFARSHSLFSDISMHPGVSDIEDDVDHGQDSVPQALQDQASAPGTLETGQVSLPLPDVEPLEKHIVESWVVQPTRTGQEDASDHSSSSPLFQEPPGIERFRAEPVLMNKPEPISEVKKGKVAKRRRLPKRAITTHSKLARLQDRFFMDQTRLTHTRDTMEFTLRNLRESLSHFMKIIEPVEQQAQPHQIALSSERQESYHQLLSTVDNFAADMQQVTQLEQSLGRLEYRVANLQRKLLNLIDERFEIQRNDLEQIEKATPSNGSTVSADPVDPLENEYYEKRGDVRLLREQLFNLQNEIQGVHDDECALRPASLLVAGECGTQQANTASSEQRQAEYEERKETLQQEETKLRKLWEECREAGLDVGSLDAKLSQPFDAESEQPESSVHDAHHIELQESPFDLGNFFSQALHNFRWPLEGAFAAGIGQELPLMGDKWSMIERWVQLPSGVQTISGQPGPSFATEFDYTVSTPKSDSEWLMLRKVSEDLYQPSESAIMLAEDTVARSSQAVDPRQVARLLRVSKSDELLGQSFKAPTRSPRRSAANVSMRPL